MVFIGLHQQDTILRVAVLSLDKKKLFLKETLDIDLSEENVKPFYMIPYTYLENSPVFASGVAAEKTMLRTKELFITSKKDLEATLAFQLEELIPYPLEEVVISKQFLTHKKKKSTTLQVLATQKKELKEHLEGLNVFEFEPDFVGSELMALAETTRYLHGSKGIQAAFYLEKEKALFILFDKDHILFSHPISLESSQEPIRDRLVKPLLRLHAYLKEKNYCLLSETHLSVFCKEGALQKFIAKELGFCLSEKALEEAKLTPFCMAIGFAVQAEKKENNFRDKFFISPKVFAERKKLFLQSCIFSGAAITFMAAWMFFYTGHKEKQLSQRLHALLHTPYQKHSLEELTELIQHKDHSVRKEKTLFKILLNYPNASDVLSWVSTHPALCQRDETSGEGVDLRDFHYILEEKEGKIVGARVTLKLLFPNSAFLEAFTKSLEKEPLFKKVESSSKGLNQQFVMHLQEKGAL